MPYERFNLIREYLVGTPTMGGLLAPLVCDRLYGTYLGRNLRSRKTRWPVYCTHYRWNGPLAIHLEDRLAWREPLFARPAPVAHSGPGRSRILRFQRPGTAT